MKRLSLKNSFQNAGRGFSSALKDRNFRIQFSAGVVALAASLLLPLSAVERSVIVLLVALVLVLELINSSIEGILNFLNPEWSAVVRAAKDKSAAAVLIASLVSIIVGVIIFAPYVLGLGK